MVVKGYHRWSSFSGGFAFWLNRCCCCGGVQRQQCVVQSTRINNCCLYIHAHMFKSTAVVTKRRTCASFFVSCLPWTKSNAYRQVDKETVTRPAKVAQSRRSRSTRTPGLVRMGNLLGRSKKRQKGTDEYSPQDMTATKRQLTARITQAQDLAARELELIKRTMQAANTATTTKMKENLLKKAKRHLERHKRFQTSATQIERARDALDAAEYQRSVASALKLGVDAAKKARGGMTADAVGDIIDDVGDVMDINSEINETLAFSITADEDTDFAELEAELQAYTGEESETRAPPTAAPAPAVATSTAPDTGRPPTVATPATTGATGAMRTALTVAQQMPEAATGRESERLLGKPDMTRQPAATATATAT